MQHSLVTVEKGKDIPRRNEKDWASPITTLVDSKREEGRRTIPSVPTKYLVQQAKRVKKA